MQWFSHDLITSKLNQRINIDLSVRTIHTTETFLENIFNNDEKRVIFSGKDSFDPRKLCACSKIKNTSKNFFFFLKEWALLITWKRELEHKITGYKIQTRTDLNWNFYFIHLILDLVPSKFQILRTETGNAMLIMKSFKQIRAIIYCLIEDLSRFIL